MRKALIAALFAIVALAVQTPVAFAEDAVSYTVSTDRVALGQDKTGSFTITIHEPGISYAGVRIHLILPEGIVTDKPSDFAIDYSEEGVALPLTQIDGVSSFGLMTDNTFGIPYENYCPDANIYSGPIACSVGFQYIGQGEGAITVGSIERYAFCKDESGEILMQKVVSEQDAVRIAIVPFGSEDADEPGNSVTIGDGAGAAKNGADGTSQGADADGVEGLGGETEGVADGAEGEDGDGEPDELAAAAPEPPIPQEPPELQGQPGVRLDKSNLKAYIFGYPDGTFGPGSNITRAETASMLYSLVDDPGKAGYARTAGRFSDAPADGWYSAAVGYLSDAEIILGYPDGTFQGGNEITRAEFATLLSKFESHFGAGELPFTDVDEGHWAHGFILKAYSNNWLRGYPDGTFMPDRSITRAEAVAMVNRMLGREPADYEGYAMKFTDAIASEWHYGDILAASSDRA